MNRKALGQQGEDMACTFLTQQGYRIVQRNFSCRYGEIDIIAAHQETLIFVEVKTRRNTRYGSPEEAVTALKIQHIRHTALEYLRRSPGPHKALRFDVIAIQWRAGQPVINHIEDAF
jgi:putative endonuclease